MNRTLVTVLAGALLGAGSLFAQGNMPANPPAPAAGGAMKAAAPAGAVVQGPIMTTLKADWQRVRDMVVNISDIVPEEKYGFQATPDVRTFRELFQHITTEGVNFLGPLADLEGITRLNTQGITAMTTKADLMKAMKDSYDWQAKVIDGLSEAQAMEMTQGRGGMSPRWNAIVNLLIDNMDHYGNLVTYVRLNGMVPPTTAARGAGRGGRGGGGGGGGGAGAGAGGAGGGGAPRGQ